MRNKSVIEKDKNTCRKDFSKDYNDEIENNVLNVDIKDFFNDKA